MPPAMLKLGKSLLRLLAAWFVSRLTERHVIAAGDAETLTHEIVDYAIAIVPFLAIYGWDAWDTLKAWAHYVTALRAPANTPPAAIKAASSGLATVASLALVDPATVGRTEYPPH